MDYEKFFMIFLLIFMLGCSTSSQPQKQAYAQVYRQNVKTQMDVVMAGSQGGQFPYYHWASPIVQSVRVPGHIANGVFIPAHEELVIIKPGEWVQNPAYPIESQKERHEQSIPTINMDVADITHLPSAGPTAGVDPAGKGPDLKRGVVQAK